MSIHDLVAEIMAPASRGRKPSGVQGSVTRELEPADIQKLHGLSFGALGSVAAPLKRLKHSHHGLARLVADGVREAEISSVTGYSLTYISTIKKSPDFVELVAYYAEQKREVYLDVHQRLSSLSMDAVDELQGRLADDPERFDNRELKEIAEMGLDRVGYGKATQVNHSHKIALVDPAQIARLKDDLRTRQTGVVTPLLTQGHPESKLGGPVIEGTLAETESSPERAGEGTDVPDKGSEGSQEDGGLL
jgi:hypothetical protein